MLLALFLLVVFVVAARRARGKPKIAEKKTKQNATTIDKTPIKNPRTSATMVELIRSFFSSVPMSPSEKLMYLMAGIGVVTFLVSFIAGTIGLFAGLRVNFEQKKEVLVQRSRVTAAESKLEAEKRKRLSLEASLAPRTIVSRHEMTPDGLKTNFDELKRAAGANVLIVPLLDAEPRRLAYNIAGILNEAGWRVAVRPTLDLSDDGVTVRSQKEVLPDENDKTSFPAALLVAFLKRNKIEVRSAMSVDSQKNPLPGFPIDTVVVQIGLKPETYFTQLYTEQSVREGLIKKRANLLHDPHFRGSLIGALRQTPKIPVRITCSVDDAKSCEFAAEILALLKEAEWPVDGDRVTQVEEYIPPDVTVFAANDPNLEYGSTTDILERVLGAFWIVKRERTTELPKPFIGIAVGAESDNP